MASVCPASASAKNYQPLIFVSSALDSPWKVYLSEVDPTITAIPVGGLTPARTYQFRLCAVNQVGRGQYSAETQR